MRIWRKAFLMIVCLAGLTACEQEIVSPEQQITGEFAFDDGTGLTGEYIEFSKGVLSVFQLSEPYPFAERTIWNDGQANVVNKKKNPYMIADRVLTSGGENLGLAELRGDVLRIGDKTYGRLTGFSADPYSVIRPEKEICVHPLQAGEYSNPVTIENPIPAGKLTVIGTSGWISGATVKDGTLSYHVSASKAPRTGEILLGYTHAKEVAVPIHQTQSTYIRLKETTKDIGYQSANVEIPYSIDNPVTGSALTVSGKTDWIRSITVQSGKVIIGVSANYCGFSRSAELAFSYEGAMDVVLTLNQDTQPITSLTLNKSNVSLYTGENVTLRATVTPSNAEPRWKSSKTDVATVTQSGTVLAVGSGKSIITVYCGDKSATCTVIVSSPCPDGAVDLGMTTDDGNKLYWAKCNVCETGFVSSPGKLGDVYAWGETETKSSYNLGNWGSYKWCKGSANTLTKYNYDSSYGIVDNKMTLETGPDGDDVASKVLGARWRIPTYNEWDALLTQCTWTWVSQDGVRGCLVTGSNGNSIFIPSARVVHYGGSVYSYGYWCSSLNPRYPTCSDTMEVCSALVGDEFVVWYTRSRSEQYYIRPVSE